jgi:hypothetical protein
VFAHGKRLNARQCKTDDTPMAQWRANRRERGSRGGVAYVT